ncbi:ATP-dependent DNA ligase [Candidatus Woesearchaeota archaeon]|nr:ATP-dependent DNA ligase [Candidatus Woesearchaeota archaeon]
MDYKKLVELYAKIEATSKRLEKTFLVSGFLRDTDMDDIPMITLLLQGRVFPPMDERKMGVAARLVIKALNKSMGIDGDAIEREWKKTGDLGLTAENLVKRKKQVTLFVQKLTVAKVFANLQKLSTLEGSGTVNQKVGLISELLTSASPEEARYVVRTVLEDLRVGIGEGVLRDAIVWAFFDESIHINYDPEKKAINPQNRELYNAYVDAVQEAYDIINDFSEVANIANTSGLKGLKAVSIDVGRPVKVMLYQKVAGIEEAFDRVGRPAAFEYKYDGFRIQAHRKGDKITLFTRRLEEVTDRFPEVVEYIRDSVDAREFIIDTEAVGFDPKSKKYLPFQSISQRIKRKYDIEKMAQDFPVEINVFDIISFEGESLLKMPFSERRKIIERILEPVPFRIRPAEQIITEDVGEAQRFYEASLASGEEGVMVKKLDGIYKPGSRVGYGVKVKPVMESLDLVIVAAEWGEGKRSGWLTSFTLACYDPDTNSFLEIGKVGTGMKEKAAGDEESVQFGQLTELLKPVIIKEKGRDVWVKPMVVVEINFEEIQKSPTYSSGYALRFPRVIRLRPDRSPEECSDLSLVQSLYSTQRGRG